MSPNSAPEPFKDHRQTALTPALRWTMAAGIMALLACELFLSVRQESQVFDEAAHLYSGVEYWKHGDFGMNPEHPPLAKLVAALPVLPMNLKDAPRLPIPHFKAETFIRASMFLYAGDADSLLMRARIAVALVFTIGLGLMLLAAASEMFDVATGLIALLMLAIEPVVLANGPLITTDMGLACLMFASVYAFYRYVKEPGVLRLLLCAAASGLAVAVKHSGALVLPALFILAVSEIARRWLQERSRNIPGRDRHALWQLARFTSAFIFIAGVSYAMLWAFYGFRYQTRPSDLQLVPSYAAYLNELKDPLQRSLFDFFARHHLFPEAYLYGWIDILLIPGMRFTFVFGKLYSSGQWFFFPAMLLIKSTIPLLLLMTLVPFAGFGKYRRELLFLVIPPVFFLLIAILSNLNLGVRHILPVYPFCILLAAAAGRRIAARSRPLAAAVAGLLVLAVVSSARSFPDYLAYSNEAFGGPSNTYRVVTDANADWGQGLKWAKEYLNSNHISDCWFDYNVPFVDPTYYKIGCKQLPSAFHVLGFAPMSSIPLSISGTILISATEAEGLLWGPESLNPYQQFTQRRPDAVIGNIILVYKGTFDVPLLSAMSHAASARSFLAQKNVPQALAEAQTAVRQAPDSAAIHLTLGQILMMTGKREEAQQSFATALRIARTDHPDFQGPLVRTVDQFSH